MRASEIMDLAGRAGIEPGVSVVDLCCGIAGPGRLLVRQLGCTYLGVDASAGAIDVARERTDGRDCRFEVARMPPVPAGPFDVVLLLETMLAFADKEALLRDVRSALAVGGRFAFTVEEGAPLTTTERERMPDADTVNLIAMPDLVGCLRRAGLRVRWQRDCSRAHLAVVDSLVVAITSEASQIAAQVGHHAVGELLAAHRLWAEWLRAGRVRKFAFIAEPTRG